MPCIKNTSNIRILNINPNGLRETADLKIQQLTQSISKYDLDIIILNETNCKWTTLNQSKIKKKLMKIHKNI